MSGIQGIDEFDDFADTMSDISNQQSGIGKAKRDALRDTVKELKGLIREQLVNAETSQDGTFYSESSPYKPGTTNESSGSSKHLREVTSWNHEIVGSDSAVVYPHPEIRNRARFAEYGTKDHEPDGEDPYHFRVNGVRVVVTQEEDPDEVRDRFRYLDATPTYSPFQRDQILENRSGEAAIDNAFSDDPASVDGVPAQRFLKKAIRAAEGLNIFEENMKENLNNVFLEEGVPLEGDW